MKSTKRSIAMLEVAKGGATHLKIELYYAIGGMNYFSGGSEKRGLYLSVSPVSRAVGNGFVSESFTAFSGVKELVKEMKRFNQKELDNYVIDQSQVQKLIDHVVNKGGITLKQNLVVS